MFPVPLTYEKFFPWVLRKGTLCDIGDHFIYPYNKCNQQFLKHKINSVKIQSSMVWICRSLTAWLDLKMKFSPDFYYEYFKCVGKVKE